MFRIHPLILATVLVSEIKQHHLFIFQDGRIDYNEFVAMMQKGNPEFDKKGLQTSALGIGFREALSVC